MKQLYFVLFVAFFSGLHLNAQSSEIDITSSLDNTIFKDLESSNGKGEYLFSGTTNENLIKRAMVQFDLDDVPAGVQVDSAFLILKPVNVEPASTVISVYRVLTQWGEGDSNDQDEEGNGAPATEGDATWTFAIFPTDPWIKGGGDYELEASVSDTVSSGTDAFFSSVKLTLDVNYWLQNPSENYGWILIGDELNTATSVKFGSRDNNDNLLWPLLKLYHQGTSSVHEIHPLGEMQVFQLRGTNGLLIRNPYHKGNARLEIFSITGARLWSSGLELIAGENHISTGRLGTGLYLYRITLNGISDSGKLLITNP